MPEVGTISSNGEELPGSSVEESATDYTESANDSYTDAGTNTESSYSNQSTGFSKEEDQDEYPLVNKLLDNVCSFVDKIPPCTVAGESVDPQAKPSLLYRSKSKKNPYRLRGNSYLHRFTTSHKKHQKLVNEDVLSEKDESVKVEVVVPNPSSPRNNNNNSSRFGRLRGIVTRRPKEPTIEKRERKRRERRYGGGSVASSVSGRSGRSSTRGGRSRRSRGSGRSGHNGGQHQGAGQQIYSHGGKTRSNTKQHRKKKRDSDAPHPLQIVIESPRNKDDPESMRTPRANNNRRVDDSAALVSNPKSPRENPKSPRGQTKSPSSPRDRATSPASSSKRDDPSPPSSPQSSRSMGSTSAVKSPRSIGPASQQWPISPGTASAATPIRGSSKKLKDRREKSRSAPLSPRESMNNNALQKSSTSPPTSPRESTVSPPRSSRRELSPPSTPVVTRRDSTRSPPSSPTYLGESTKSPPTSPSNRKRLSLKSSGSSRRLLSLKSSGSTQQ